MEETELKIVVDRVFPEAVLEEAEQWVTVPCTSPEWLNAAMQLRNDPIGCFDYLFCMTCIDWKTNLTMVYHLGSTKHLQTLVVKVVLDRANPEIESVSGIWKTALFHERENFEMFGVKFLNHPDLRLLILPDNWEGRNPLRKDFEDPINMIKL